MGDYTPNREKITLGCGEEIELEEMTILGLEDAEKEIGRKRDEWVEGEGDDRGMPLSDVITVLWVCARGTGRSKEQRLNEEWAFTRRQFANMVTATDLERHSGVIERFFHQTQGATQAEPGSEPSESSA